jgi:hypothetical protein
MTVMVTDKRQSDVEGVGATFNLPRLLVFGAGADDPLQYPYGALSPVLSPVVLTS